MPLIKANNILERIHNSHEDIPSFERLQCWEKSQGSYTIYVFSIQIDKESDLVEINDKLRDFIAIFFQSQILDKMVEKWNIYQVIFVNEKVSPPIKQKIEQDKFATRKIVLSDFQEELPELDIKQLIADEIFNFTITPTKSVISPLIGSLSNEDKEVINLISEYSSLGVKANIDAIIDRLNNE
jgi:hypothetical protein